MLPAAGPAPLITGSAHRSFLKSIPISGPMLYGHRMRSKTTFTILLGGALDVTPRLREAVSGSRFIAADGGMQHAPALGVQPELWVGDFDSTPQSLLDMFAAVPRQPFPAEKAETDGEIAVSEAMARGATRLVLAGALGGTRSDHAFQHLVHAVSLAMRGLDVLLTSGEEEGTPLLPGETCLDLPPGSLFSIIGLTTLEGLCIGNARYPLNDFHLDFGSPRTISNVAEGPVTLSLAKGRGIVLARPYDFSGR